MCVDSELTFFKRLQVVGVLHACFLLIIFIIEGLLGFELITWWINPNWERVVITIVFWFIAPKIIAMLDIKV